MKFRLIYSSILSQMKVRHWWLGVLLWMILIIPAQASVIMRVAIERDVDKVKVGSSTAAIVKDGSGRSLGKLPGREAYYAQPVPGGVALDKWKSALFWIEPEGKGFVYIGDRWYRGRTLVIPTQKGLTAVNWVDLEEYLYSVLGGEMDARWHPEALKAQAIAARSYALYRRERQQTNPLFDVGRTPDKWQIYKGVIAEDPKIYAAVDATAGQVLTHNNQIIESVFHACSGGHTENVEDVWGNSLPYLRAVPDFDLNTTSTSNRCKWQQSFSSTEISQKFPEIGSVQEMKLVELSPFNSVKKLQIIGEKGIKELKGEQVRTTLKLNSTRFTVNKQQDGTFVLNGLGWGHGLGMSQYGASYLANQGYNHLQILNHYYKNVALAPIQVK
ncbi:MAG: SpoIID/LytB domain-containing protein [Rivularia sp. T60_A2020_040]|nr:SpoIID/LytB domain-containing protein [Rivularia sp. T60_A2020_040]